MELVTVAIVVVDVILPYGPLTGVNVGVLAFELGAVALPVKPVPLMDGYVLKSVP